MYDYEKKGVPFEGKNLEYLYCVSKYPTKFNEINWNKAVTFDGFSDHTIGISAPILYATLKKIKGSKNILIENTLDALLRRD